MVKYTLKKRNNKSKIKRKVKKSIKKTFKKSLKNRKKVFRKSVNKKTKNYKKKKEGGFLGIAEGQTCNEVGWYNNGFNMPGGDTRRPFDYYSKIKDLVENSKNEKRLANVQASWSDTYKQFLIAFLSNYQYIQTHISDFEKKQGEGLPFKRRIDRVVTEHGHQVSSYNSIIHSKEPIHIMKAYFPSKREGENDIETLDQRIFNLIMHEFDHFTCNIGHAEYGSDNKTFAEHSSGKTNFNNITTIQEFLNKFPSFKNLMSKRVKIQALGQSLRIYRFISLIRIALGKFRNQLETV